MEIYLYNNKSDADYVNKDLTVLAHIENGDIVHYVNGADKLHADFKNCRFEGVNLIDLRRTCNYMKFVIDDNIECYFVEDVIYHNGLYDFKTKKDVLCTYWDKIKGQKGIVESSETIQNKFIYDGNLPLQTNSHKSYLEFPTGFIRDEINEATYLLTM